MTTIRCNGDLREVPDGATVADLVAQLVSGEPRGTAVAVDGEVVRRADWATTVLRPDADVEVLRAVQGGSR